MAGIINNSESNWNLINLPYLTILSSISYMFAQSSIKSMKSQEALKPCSFLKFYYIFRIFLTFYLLTKDGALELFKNFYDINYVSTDNELSKNLVELDWWFFLLSLLDFIDIAYLITQKTEFSTTQLIYYGIIPLIAWTEYTDNPGSYFTMFRYFRCFIDVFTYIYYLSSVFNSNYDKESMWIHRIEALKLIHVSSIFMHGLQIYGTTSHMFKSFYLVLGWQSLLIINFFIQETMKIYEDRQGYFSTVLGEFRPLLEMCIPNQHTLYNDDKSD